MPSCYLDACTILVPANESFYIRTFKACMQLIDDADPRGSTVDFIHQEVRHGATHKRRRGNLDAPGYRFLGFSVLNFG